MIYKNITFYILINKNKNIKINYKKKHEFYYYI